MRKAEVSCLAAFAGELCDMSGFNKVSPDVVNLHMQHLSQWCLAHQPPRLLEYLCERFSLATMCCHTFFCKPSMRLKYMPANSTASKGTKSIWSVLDCKQRVAQVSNITLSSETPEQGYLQSQG